MASGSPPAVLEAVPFAQVRVADEFWKPRLDVLRTRTLPHNFAQCEETGRLANFDVAAGKRAGKFSGYFFNDSDVYKMLEGAAYALQTEHDADLEARVDALIARIAAAQQEDGYLNTYFTLTPSEERWSNTRVRHELYCAGHLIEAAVAHYQATGKRTLLDVALRLVDLIDATFGPEKRHDVPGHEEIELALIRLYRVTEDPRHLALARFFVEQRGRADGRELYGEYCQDHAPVREQHAAVGHAVRAMYLYCAIADLAAISGDAGLLAMQDAVWHDLVDTKMYITGGIGASRDNEGFTEPFDLPNESAYAETCAAIGLCMWNHRLNLLHRDARYADVLERALYNNVPAAISLDGTKFFYTNPLASSGDHHRRAWYPCACCPPNLVRFLPTVGGYAYAHDAEEIYVNLYIAGEAEVKLAEGRVVRLRQDTQYPWDGRVRLVVDVDAPTEFALKLRIPGWCADARVAPPGADAGKLGDPLPIARALSAGFELSKGYLGVKRTWKAGDAIELFLAMPVQRVQADSRVAADRGRVALERGPLVYCLEAVDNDTNVLSLALPCYAENSPTRLMANPTFELPPDAGLVYEVLDTTQLGGVVTIHGWALTPVASPADGWEQAPYQRAPAGRLVKFTAIPYCAWDNRDPGAMVVWLPESLTLLDRPPVAWVIPSASHCYENDTLTALHDRREPADSAGKGLPRFTWWPRRGCEEWVQYDFASPRTVSSVSVYWFDDTLQRGQCRPPANWRLLYRDGGEWREIPGVDAYGTAVDAFNVASFDPVVTDGLRIVAQLQPELCAGILEWRVDTE